MRLITKHTRELPGALCELNEQVSTANDPVMFVWVLCNPSYVSGVHYTNLQVEGYHYQVRQEDVLVWNANRELYNRYLAGWGSFEADLEEYKRKIDNRFDFFERFVDRLVNEHQGGYTV